jgi:hypothetical protein
MTRYLCAAVTLGFIAVAIPVRAADGPHAGTDSHQALVWTNDDLESLHVPGLICIVGRTNEETPKPASSPAPYAQTQDPEWYAQQAAKLRDELEWRNAQLAEYRQGIEDATTLKPMTDGINLDASDIGITPEAGIEILSQRVDEAQAALDALEDLARRNGIPPGTLRSQETP